MRVSRRRSRPGPRMPQQARSRRTRQRILDSAVRCFELYGYDGTTTAAIARRARVAVGTLYGYFPDKRAILLELLQSTTTSVADMIVRNLDPAAWDHADPRASVRALIDALLQSRTLNPGVQRILWERYFKDDEFRQAVEDTERRIRAAMVTLFAALRAEGRLRVDDPETAAFVIYAAVEWIASRLMLGTTGADIGAAAAALSDMVSRFVFHAPEDAVAARSARGVARLRPAVIGGRRATRPAGSGRASAAQSPSPAAPTEGSPTPGTPPVTCGAGGRG